MPGEITIKQDMENLKQTILGVQKTTENYGQSAEEIEKNVTKEVEKHTAAIAANLAKRDELAAQLRTERSEYNKQKREVDKLTKERDKAEKKLATTKSIEGVDPKKIKSAEDELTAARKRLKDATQQLNLMETTQKQTMEENYRKRERATQSINKHRKAVNEATRAQKDQNHEMLNFSKRLDVAIKKIITYRLAFGAYQAATRALSDANQEAFDLNDTFQDLRKVMVGTDADFTRLRKTAFDMGIVFGRSANEVAKSFAVFAQQGLAMDEVVERTQAVMLLTAASTLQTTDAVEALTAVVKAYPEYVNNVTAAVDKWVAVQARAPVTAKDLAHAMQGVGISAAEMGVSLDELNGIVASIAEVTRKSGKAIGTSLKTIFARLPRPTTTNALKEMGIAVQSTQNDYRSFNAVLIDIREKWDDLTGTQKKNLTQVLGGIRRYNDLTALIKNYDRFLLSTAESIASQGDALNKTEEDIEKYTRQLQSAKTALSELTTKLAEKITIPAMLTLTQQSAVAAQTIDSNTDAFKTATKASGFLAASVLALSLAFKGTATRGFTALKIIRGIGPALQAMSIRTATAAVGMRALGLAMGPVGIAFSILAPLIFTYINKARAQKERTDELTASIRGEAKALKELEEAHRIVNETAADIDKRERISTALAEFKLIEARLKSVQKEREERKKQRHDEEEIAAFHAQSLKKMAKERETLGKIHAPAMTDAQRKINKDQEALLEEFNKNQEKFLAPSFSDKVLDERTKELEEQLEKARVKLQNLIQKKEIEWFPIKLSTYYRNLTKIEVAFDDTQRRIQRSAEVAKLFGKSFIESEKRLSIIRGLLTQIDTLEQDTRAKERELDLIDERLKFSNLELEQAKKLERQQKQLNLDIANTKEQREALTKALEKEAIIATAQVRKELAAVDGITLATARTNAQYDIQIDLLKTIGRGFGKLSSQRALDFTNVQAILAQEKKILAVQEAKAISAIEANKAKKRERGLTDDTREMQQENLKIEETRIRYAKERIKLDIKALSQINKSIENIQMSLVQGFSAGFTSFLDNIVEYKRTTAEITESRKEAEKDLAAAIAANDVAAINEAKNRLIDLKNELKNLKPVWLDIFTGVGDVAVKQWSEQFANAILAGQASKFLASGILPASVLGAQKYYEAIVQATAAATAREEGETLLGTRAEKGTIYGKFAKKQEGEIKETERKIGELPEGLSNAGIKVASRWETAIENGGNLASLSLLRAFNVGTGEVSNSLANVGSLFGNAASKEFLGDALGSFAGPVGTLVGGLVGGVIGELFEKDPEPSLRLDENTQAIRENTIEVQNNNDLLALQREFINAPTGYIPPAATGFGSGGNGDFYLNVSVNGTNNPQAVAQEVIGIVDQAYAKSARRTQSNFSRFGS